MNVINIKKIRNSAGITKPLNWIEVRTPSYSKQTTKIFEEMKMQNRRNQDIIAACSKDLGENNFIIQLFGKQSGMIAYERFSVNHFDNYIYANEMHVKNGRLRNKNFGHGELLSLLNIIELLENQMKSIKLFATKTAVFFHAKSNFRPNITETREAKKFITWLTELKEKEFRTLSDEAKTLKQAIEAEGGMKIQELELRKAINILAEKFLNKSMENNQPERLFPEVGSGMDMLLTEKDIYDKRDLYNKLFDKRKIGYKI